MADSISSDIEALDPGARWRRCAFQVNPFSYVEGYQKNNAGAFTDEDSYNKAMVAALKAEGIEAIGMADHWCADSSDNLATLAMSEGIIVFPGFEATTKEGVHLLVLFDPGTSSDAISRRIGECGIAADCRDARPGKLDVTEMLERSAEWHAVVIAPHVWTEKGLLDVLKGQPAMTAWKHPGLHAVALSGGKQDPKVKSILANSDPSYKREHPVAQLRAADLHDPASVSKSGSSCWVKMSSPTVDGLDVAFRSPETRVSLDDPTETSHPVIVGMAWEGGFLDGARVRMNESFNVLVGGRGSGKSTIIESLRYVFDVDPVGSTAKAEHDAMVKSHDVLGPGTRVHVLVESRQPHVERFVVQRTVPNQPVVTTIDGVKSDLRPHDLIRGMEIYGQRELAELARDKEKLTALLARYVPDAERAAEDHRHLQRKLRDSRLKILQQIAEIDSLDEQIERLPSLQARLQSFEKAGVAERLADQAKVQRESGMFDQAEELLKGVAGLPEVVRDGGTIDVGFLNPEDGTDLPNRVLLDRVSGAVGTLNAAIEEAASSIADAVAAAQTDVEAIKTEWSGASEATRQALDALLRELQPSGTDAQEYLNLQREVARLQPLETDRKGKEKTLDQLREARTSLLIDKENLRGERLRSLNGAAKKVSRALKNLVRVNVIDGGDRLALTKLIKQSVSGRSDKICDAIEKASLLSVREFASTCRAGSAAIMTAYPDITQAQAEALAGCGEESFMKFEEVELSIGTELQLNIRPEDGNPSWRHLDQLSTGQRATALLLLLLQGGEAPLVIDQPEDDLDNRFVYESIVPRVRACKTQRQLVFASHNANIPVLGDADQIVGLQAVERDGAVVGEVDPNAVGSIDHRPVRALVEELLEGGKEAFEMRRYLYGF